MASPAVPTVAYEATCQRLGCGRAWHWTVMDAQRDLSLKSVRDRVQGHRRSSGHVIIEIITKVK